MDRLIGAVAYVALDLVILWIGPRLTAPAKDGLPNVKRLTLAAFALLPFPFLQFWVLTHDFLLQPLLVVIVLAAITLYVSTSFQGAMGLRNVGNENKLAVSGAISGRDAVIRFMLTSVLYLVLLIVADVVVLKAYLAPYSYPQQFVTTIAVLHFTVRGSLLLLSAIFFQLQVSNSYFDDDVRSSLVVSQIASTIGAVYTVFIPLFAFDLTAIRSEELRSVLTTLPVWALFSIYLAAYMLVWLAAFITTSVHHASQNDQFKAFRRHWLAATKSELDTTDDKARHAELLSQLALLLRQFPQFRGSPSVSEYITWLATPHLAEIAAAIEASEAPADVVADVRRFVDFCEAHPPLLPQLFVEYRDSISEWDNRLTHVHALIGYARRTAVYLGGTMSRADYAGYIHDAAEREKEAAEPQTTRLRTKTIGFITSGWAVIAAVITAYDKLWPHVRAIIKH